MIGNKHNILYLAERQRPEKLIIIIKAFWSKCEAKSHFLEVKKY